jgi:hypothetical protein
LYHRWLISPFRDTSGVPSVAPHLLASFIILIIISTVNQQTGGIRALKWTIVVAVIIWLYITSIENIQRNRIVFKVESNAFQTMFRGDNDVLNKFCDSVKKSSGSSASYMYFPLVDLICADQNLGVQVQSSNDEAHSNFVSLFFVNKILASLWTVDGTGGLGTYYSGIIQSFLSYQLQLVPPSIAHLSISDFSIGSTPPVVKAVQVRSYLGDCTHVVSEEKKAQQKYLADTNNLFSLREKIMHQINTTKDVRYTLFCLLIYCCLNLPCSKYVHSPLGGAKRKSIISAHTSSSTLTFHFHQRT